MKHPLSIVLFFVFLIMALPAYAAHPSKQDILIRKLMARVDQLEREVSDLKQQRGGAPSAKKAEARSTAPAETADVGEDRTPPADEPIEKSVESQLVHHNVVLLQPWTYELEPGITYAHSSTDAVSINGFSIFPVLIVGSVTSEQIRRDTLLGSMTARAGLPYGSQVDIRVPWQYIDQETTQADGHFTHDSTNGIGDVSIGLSKELLTQRDAWPSLIGRVSWKTDTGASTYDGDPLGIGSGFNSLRGEATVLKTTDPAAVYSTIGYTTSFKAHKPAGDIHLGDSLDASLGMTIALNRDLAFSFGVQDMWSMNSTVNGSIIKGSDLNAGNLNFGMSYELLQNRRLDFSAAMGLTRDAPDFTMTVSMPFRFK